MTILESRKWGRDYLTQSPSPELDSDVLLSFVTGKDKTHLLFDRDVPLSKEQEDSFAACIRARSTGLPVAYITGIKEFYGYEFHVTPDVLIPKPDTELLVDNALKAIEEKLSAKNRILTICDMCTGSGCVALSILKAALETGIVTKDKLPLVTMADISLKALDIARQNAQSLFDKGMQRQFRFIQSNLFEMVPGSFDIIVSNPPYIPSKEAKELLLDGRSEPLLALDGDVSLSGDPTGDNDGLGVIRNLIPQAVNHLAPYGVLIIEAGEYNAEMCEYLFRNAGLVRTHISKDLEGQLRDITGYKEHI